ncbi:UbiD family decarboxylase [Terriglobus roseus]|uniref:4-hydroxy-3-polyprenylbenzoate decarboxylase n=1 Tax=Terriglobus roseus TaxID=392734 RepID=A0A1H4SDY6_9BACT|nr:UbiD family decarboxylase [Terriglobus roseus]SEC42244.1 4-hydroxy-3-polyprenylbenzoate decarboxylase [Terriglobus roseus]
MTEKQNLSPEEQESPINDLRSALDRLRKYPGQLIETDHIVDPQGELAGVYKRIGAAGTVVRPTQTGPAMIFNNVKDYPGSSVLVGLLASRERTGILLDAPKEKLTEKLFDAINHGIDPVQAGPEDAKCQELVYRATDPDFDLRRILPAPTNTDHDAGPYFCMGLVLASDPELGTNVTIHRLCVQGKDKMTIFFAPGRIIDIFRQRQEANGKELEVTINMGLDPAIYIGAEFEMPTVPVGYNELRMAGGLRQEPVKLVKGVTVQADAIAYAEIIIEGKILPNVREAEDQNTHTGFAMPEFPGYNGVAAESLPVIQVTAITTRRNPILQTLVGPGEEHVSLAGLPTEGSIYDICHKAMPGFVTGVYCHPAGGGKFLGILRCRKTSAYDDGRARQAALLAFGTYSEMKNIILIDEDVDMFETDDVLWAMTTRMQGSKDILVVPGVSCHVLDPSQTPEYDPTLPAKGVTSKTIYDATKPFHMRDKFERAQFRDVDPRPFAPELNLRYP